MPTVLSTVLTKLRVLGSDTFEKDVTELQRQIDKLKIYQQKKQTQPHRVEKPRRTRRV